eukprot:scaffold1743_cov344-Prasinococcus_capsulatus_cf.AAC.4
MAAARRDQLPQHRVQVVVSLADGRRQVVRQVLVGQDRQPVRHVHAPAAGCRGGCLRARKIEGLCCPGRPRVIPFQSY